MTADSLSLPITKPVSIWNKPLKADFKAFFKSLTKAAAQAAFQSWPDALAELAEAMAAIGIETKPEELAWVLIRRSLEGAIVDLVRESTDLLGEKPDDPDAFVATLDLGLEAADLTIERSFFDRPGELSILPRIQEPFRQWLIGHGLSIPQARATANRLPSYFVYALNEEWRRRPEQYVRLEKALDTPFTQAGERERAWNQYSAGLVRQVNTRMFGEAFGLADVYVPLRAYYHEKVEERKEGRLVERVGGLEGRAVRVLVDLDEELSGWVEAGDKDDAVRVVAGGPGSGKSSFAKMFTAKLAGRGRRVLFVPLHLFDPTGDLDRSIDAFVRRTEILPGNPLDSTTGPGRILIVFDGLDELMMQGREAAEVAKNFIDEVRKFVAGRNHERLRVQALIGGRELVVQANKSQFRRDRQLLHLLPYYVAQADRERWFQLEAGRDPKNLLPIDQRDSWWRRYAAVTERPYEALPAELKRPDLDDVTAQPLLNYLLALSFTRNKLDFSKEVNLNEIYQDLLEAVYVRDYAGGQQHPSVGGMSFKQFDRVLQEIGLAAWHGDGRTTTVKEIERHCHAGGLSALLATFRDGSISGAARLLAAFYFRQHGAREGDPTFEFTHKSFGEYLAAKRIVYGLRMMQEEIELKKQRYDRGWDERRALEEWAKLCGSAALDADLYRFVKNEVSLVSKNEVQTWQRMLCDLIGFLLENGMPMEKLDPRPNYLVESRQARNAEEALLAALNACALVTGERSVIRWPEPTSFGAWLARLQGQRKGALNGLALQSLALLTLDGCILDIHDLYDANLEHAHLKRTSLIRAHLELANLRGASLEDADLERANLKDADLEGAHLEDANLLGANLERANLKGADLEGAHLEDANLLGANLEGANLKRANLVGADLERAHLERAHLEGAHLEGAHLEGANLEGANLEGAHLEGARNVQRPFPPNRLQRPKPKR